MDLDAVETGRDRVGRALLETVDDAWNLRKFQRPRFGNVREGAADEGLGLGEDRRWRHRCAAVRLQRGMRDAADMPELKEDVAALRVHALGDLAPSGDLLLRINAGGILISLTLLGDLGGFSDQQSGGSALAVIFNRERIGHEALQGAIAGQWRHRKTIGKCDRTKLERFKEFGRGHFY